ncbi:ATP-binding protein [Saccharothrix coeruleofusca]|uniref:HTH luxR-type domain-containing protein n=1 Tax=Saccharothrix coeruleofusca TaxID=33919 RepID=A0A918ATL4_9PSEU|nr:helix-turn-helix transcriptional regulator [Saccharothrix coeruleofusca]GGP82629.1 hypothetical protein GCM10010185_65830 [Saccharothrix coeruleofusca]
MLLDRETELARIGEALRAAAAGDGSLLVVSGPLGIGKTALLRAVADDATAAGASVLRATASVAEREFSFGVVRQVFEPAVAALPERVRARVLGEVADCVRPLVGGGEPACDTESPIPVEHALLHGLRRLLSVLSGRQPVVVLVDDLQWADEESLRCLGYLFNRLDGLGVLAVVVVRDGDADSERPLVRNAVGGALGVLRPGGLSAAAVRELVRQWFGEPGGERFDQECSAVSGGNPLLLRSILTDLTLAGYQPGDRAADAVRACRPAPLRNRLLARLRGQPAPVRAFAEALCFLGDAPDMELVGSLAGLDPIACREIARSLARQGLITTSTTPEFTHPVVRDAIEELTTAAEGERLHTAAAALLHRGGYPAEAVAAHLLAVSSPQQLWAVDVLRAAAESAAQRGEHELAARYLRRALLDASADSGERAELLVELAAVERAVDTSASVRHVLEAVSLLRTAPERAAALVRLAPSTLGAAPLAVSEVVRDVATALGEVERLVGVDRELALRLEARLRYLDDSDARDLLAAAHRLHGLDHQGCLRTPAGRELLAALLHAAALTGRESSDRIAGLGHQLLRLESPEPVHLHSSLPIVISALTLADRAEAATPWLDAALHQARRHRDPVALAVAEVDRALALMGAGRLVEAESVAEASITAMGSRWFDAVTTSGVLLAMAALELPDLQLAERITGLCADRVDHPALRALDQYLHGVRAAVRGELPMALERFLDCGRQLERAGWRNPLVLPWRVRAAEVRHRLGSAAAALELAEAELDAARTWGAPVGVGRALRVQGALRAGDAGVRLTRDALDVLEESENRLELARAHLQLGRLLGRLRSADAPRHARRGRALALECGASWLVDPATDGEPQPGLVLTRAERRVAELAAAGRTNQAVAEELGVSSRAVEKHLTNVYRKLSLSGRAELKSALLG